MKNEEIHVRVVSYGPGRPLMMLYCDPVSGERVTRSARTYDRGEAERVAGDWETALRTGRYVARRGSPPSFPIFLAGIVRALNLESVNGARQKRPDATPCRVGPYEGG